MPTVSGSWEIQLPEEPQPRSGPATFEADAAAIDPAKIRQLRELERDANPGLVARLIEVFSHSSAADLAAMKAALGGGDRQALRDAAHHLKGSCANLGAGRLAAFCHQLENAAFDAGEDRQTAVLGRLAEELGTVRAELERERSR